MLHRIFPVHDDERVERINEVVSVLFELVCYPQDPLDSSNPGALNQQVSEICHDADTAAWVCDGRRETLRNHIVKVINYLAAAPEQRDRLLNSFRHDLEYHDHTNDSSFRLEYASLNSTLQVLVKALMNYLYEYWQKHEFPANLMRGNNSFGRSHYVEEWEKRNKHLRACPACDGQRSDLRGGTRLAEVDHFLPDSIYPFFDLHPWNLVPICKDCNRSKVNIDPLLHEKAISLTHSFYPYALPAPVDVIQVTCERDEIGKLHVRIVSSSQPVRVMSLNRVFGLEERWAGRVDEVDELVQEIVSTLRARETSKDIDAETIGTELREGLEINRDTVRIGSRPNTIFYRSYIDFILSNSEEFNLFLER